jgi:hypothetical protein
VRKRIWIPVVAVAGALAVGTILVVSSVLHPEQLRARMERFLADRFDSDVELHDFGAHPLPRLTAHGSELVLRRHGAERVPFIEIKTFEVHASPFGLFRKPREIDHVLLRGVAVRVVPKRDRQEDSAPQGDAGSRPPSLVIHELVAENTVLQLEPKNPAKPPRVFDIHRVRLMEASLETPTGFEARLSIPTPPGDIDAHGRLGPWVRSDPGRMHVDGGYVFKDADLGVFKGISGRLSSTGKFDGPLEELAVSGRTETPKFALTSAGNPMPLSTEFDALVDGTSGDTILKKVRATLAKTVILTSGRVVRSRETKGRLIRLTAQVDGGRLEDLLRLTVKGPRPPMVGLARIRARMELPPGERDVIQRLRLQGEFHLASARFTDFDVQKAIASLSRRARGIMDESAPGGDRVVSNFGGVFTLADRRLYFSRLTFSVPGAQVRLTGTYDLPSERPDFTGVLVTQASLSQMTSGWKAVLAKIADLWFRRNGETVIPIKVTGTKDKPEFGLDKKRALTRDIK